MRKQETEYVCLDFAEAIRAENITGNKIDGLYIYGRPDYCDDGDGYIDDMTKRLEISYCPFCGANLMRI